MIVIVVALVAVAWVVRWIPHFLSRDLGVDHWFWKLYVRTYRDQQSFPPRISEYLLDEHQWYPPLFPLMLSKWPWTLSERGSRWIPIAIDLARMALLLWATAAFTGGSLIAIVAAGVAYALTPVLVSYNVQLNPRGLGALFLDALIVSAIAVWLSPSSSVWPVVGMLLLGALVLLTHKMTTQLLVFVCIVAACLSLDWRPILLLTGAIGVALGLSGGFYVRVLQSHADIVAFWGRNWPWLQADPVRESPIYGTDGYETPTKFYRRGLQGTLRHIVYLFGFNPWVWCFPITLFAAHRPFAAERPILIWAGLVVAFSILTVAIRPLRRFGSGYFYLYNAAFPAALAWGAAATDTAAYGVTFGIAAVAAGASIFGFCLRVRRRSDTVDAAFADMLAFIKRLPRGAVWCLPMQPNDLVAYETGQPVLYGGHGYGFRLLEDVFPRIKKPAGEICRQYDIRYVITRDGYLPDNFSNALNIEKAEAFGAYRLLMLSAPRVEASSAGAPLHIDIVGGFARTGR